ncbi:helix-turn-helix domain-containing protein, partial [Altererythrobacter lauratis]|uniref:helix-turn-helix domain-containing protein n=1 Tax=Alteraurantiacibacter lauratis TaxID=2054627 RepID=UPI0030181C01
MAQTLSQDLRDRVVAAIDSGLSCRAAAARFGVSVSSAIRWRQRALAHGQAVAKPRGGDRHSGKIEAHGGFIRELIAEQGDMTLVEVQARLIERGAPVGIGTVHRFFVRHGITRKKRPGTRSNRTVDLPPAGPAVITRVHRFDIRAAPPAQ